MHMYMYLYIRASIFMLFNNYVGMFPSDRNRRQIDKSQVA